MSEIYRGQYVLPVISHETKEVLEIEMQQAGADRFIDDAEHRLRGENPGLYSLMAQLIIERGFSEDQITAARESMVLTHELMRREAEFRVLRMTVTPPTE